MRVRYIGPCCDGDGVEIAATGQTVVRGGTVDVADELGLSLCDQPGNWAPDGDESIQLFVDFCHWVAVAPKPAAPDDVDDGSRPVPVHGELPNPGLAALAAHVAASGVQVDGQGLPPAVERPRRPKRSTDDGTDDTTTQEG